MKILFCNKISEFSFKGLVICCLLCTIVLCPSELLAKRFPFSIDSTSQVLITRSSKPGTKMVKVIAQGKSTDSAIDKALSDAVSTLVFYGAEGEAEQDGCPPVLLEGRETYLKNNKFFDKFFRKGDFLKYVEKVNSGYPAGTNNIKTRNGHRIQILLIVKWAELEIFFRQQGFKTTINGLTEF